MRNIHCIHVFPTYTTGLSWRTDRLHYSAKRLPKRKNITSSSFTWIRREMQGGCCAIGQKAKYWNRATTTLCERAVHSISYLVVQCTCIYTCVHSLIVIERPCTDRVSCLALHIHLTWCGNGLMSSGHLPDIVRRRLAVQDCIIIRSVVEFKNRQKLLSLRLHTMNSSHTGH